MNHLQSHGVVSYRKMSANDLSQIKGLCLQLEYEVSTKDLADRLKQIQESVNDHVWVAVDDCDRVVGFLHAYRRLALEAPPQVTVQALVVERTQRSRGIGRNLMRLAEDWSIEQGLFFVGLHANRRRSEAHRFYESIGYGSIAQSLSYRKNLWNNFELPT